VVEAREAPRLENQGGSVDECRTWDYVKFATSRLDCAQYKFHYRSFGLKRGFVNSSRFHSQAERVNKREIKILAELIPLSLMNYEVHNNSLDKSIPQTRKA